MMPVSSWFVGGRLEYTGSLLLSPGGPQTHYSTCPPIEDSLGRNVVYVNATETELRRWATKRVVPRGMGAREIIQVQVQVEGQAVFCAQSLHGSPAKQKAAVEAAMKWKFKQKRGNFKDYLISPLTIEFWGFMLSH
jgi:hypothetical protein